MCAMRQYGLSDILTNDAHFIQDTRPFIHHAAVSEETACAVEKDNDRILSVGLRKPQVSGEHDRRSLLPGKEVTLGHRRAFEPEHLLTRELRSGFRRQKQRANEETDRDLPHQFPSPTR